MISFPNILCSYAYSCKSKSLTSFLCKIAREAKTKLLIDSGAYTAYKIGKPVDLDEYIDFIKLLDDNGGAWNTIQLDVLGKQGETLKNLDYMYSKGVSPMPVLTVDMKSEKSIDLVEYNNYICLGGGQRTWGGAKQWQWKRVTEVDRFTKGKAKSHYLAFVRIPDLYKLPLYSSDCSTWLAGQQYSRIACYVSGGVMTGGTFYHKLHHLPKKDLNPHLVRHLNRDGITKTIWRDRNKMSVGAGSYCSFKTVAAFLALCNDAQKRNKNIFLVASSCSDFETLISVANNSDDKGYLDWVGAQDKLAQLKKLRKKSFEHWQTEMIENINCLSKGT